MKKFLILLTSIMLILSLALVGCGKEGDGGDGDGGDGAPAPQFIYTLNDDGASYSISITADYKNATEITVPDSYEGKPVTAVSARGFSGLKKMESITLPASITKLKMNAFLNSTSLETITATGVNDLSKASFSGCTKLKTVTLGAITEIPDECFKNCKALTSFAVPETVTEIGKYAFSNCLALTSVTFNENLEKIDNYAFEKCTAWQSIKFPTTKPLHLGDYAFTNCGFTSLKIPANVTLGTYTFNQLSWDEESGISACPAVYFYNENPTLATLGINSIGYTWDGPDFKVYVPQGTKAVYTQLCETIKTNGDDAWVRCITSKNKLAEFNPAENPYN